jgi:transcriptional coactivator HFI1/ADA1
MPDIDPAALSRPSISSSTPILPPKPINSMVGSAQKFTKTSAVPTRIDLEPLYSALRNAIGDNWATYKEAVGRYVLGKLQIRWPSQGMWLICTQVN